MKRMYTSFVSVIAFVFMLVTVSVAEEPTPFTDDNMPSQTQGQTQHTQSTASAAASAYGGQGGSVSNSSYNSNVNMARTAFAAVDSDNVKIGKVSKPVSKLYFQMQHENDSFYDSSSDSYQVGVSVPITWGTGVDSALDVEKQRLVDSSRRERELHQADMAKVCMELNKLGVRVSKKLSPELFERCHSK